MQTAQDLSGLIKPVLTPLSHHVNVGQLAKAAAQTQALTPQPSTAPYPSPTTPHHLNMLRCSQIMSGM